MVTVEIIAIGNELLLGDTLDTNTQWLCRTFTGLGGRVERAVLVRDDCSAIVREIRGALGRGVQLLVTSGGLGPTDDDLTLQAVAEALERPLTLNERALALVRETYERLVAAGYVADAQLTESRMKMARLPQGAEPLANPVGAAPGVLLRVSGTTLVSLPGVPAELKAIVTGPLRPILQEIFGAGVFREREVIALCRDETVLAPILREVAERHPEIYIKSRAREFGPDIRFRITLSLSGRDPMSVEARLEEATRDLCETLRRAHIEVEA
ncbi:MAG: molybdopterin-binding protein [Blastocatellia bacterium]|nr:molybdopterin-binding protein [Blastocatellia bacterium]MCS7157557.1 molybdopterin-binding protein [Blastocatellia bacterium]MCX7753509.1 molybdopterin-binding protein [Blastocatellia bacterium]MDW8166925.1 molybdopterin-binding protein [Acidobacteriota bacterium]MDW8257502.1 molybdopterin-binding protein [Acidobacteriota bacterium]